MLGEEERPGREIIQVINFRLGVNDFGVDIISVKEIIRVENITHIPEAPSFIHGLANLRGQIIPVIDLAMQFGLSDAVKSKEKVRILVTEFDGHTVGMLVDEVPGVLKITEDNIEPPPELIQRGLRRDYIRGVGKVEGRLVLLLNLEKILMPREAERMMDALPAGKEE